MALTVLITEAQLVYDKGLISMEPSKITCTACGYESESLQAAIDHVEQEHPLNK